MAYRRPGVTVTQEFVGLVPALAAFALPCVAIGPAYQLVNDDSLGSYSGSEEAYAYASLAGGAIVDTAELAEDEQFPATKKPIAVQIKNAKIEIVPAQVDGAASGTGFTDQTSNQFEDVVAGDLVVVTPVTGGTIVAAQTNGVSTDTAGQRNRLTAGTSGQFSNVKVGDTVTVTGGTNTTTGAPTVTAKLSSDLLVLSADINDGVGPATDVAFSITGDRGVANEGSHKVKAKTDDNTLVMESPWAEDEGPLAYKIERKVSAIDLVRDTDYTVDTAAVTVAAGLQYEVDGDFFDVTAGDVYASYRALRTDLAAEVKEYSEISDLQATFGTDQITPANPLAYALSIMLQNTVTAVNGLGLSADYATDETLAYTASLDALELTEMYALAPLSQSPVVHTMFKNHVEGLSLPDKKLERVVIVNSRLVTTSVLAEESTTVTTESGSRSIVSTQVDGAAAFAAPATLTDATTNQFANVAPGDTVVIVSGTNCTAGSYPVSSKTDNNTLVLASNFITSGTASNIQYYIVRKDGLGANGVTFYDRNASFLTDGVAAGHMLNILAGANKGRWKIATVDSEKQLTLAAAVTGVASLVTAVNYQVDRDLTKTEQANVIKGYSEALGSRRVVHVWPDLVRAPVGQSIVALPGTFAATAIAALTTGLPTQQGFTNLAISGFLGFDHSTRYFSEEQLNTIADGGTMVLAQDGPQQPLYVRHQLTTDRSAIKFQEFSVTKNVDFIAKFLRTSFRAFPGRYNIVDTTLDELKSTGQSCLTFLKEKTVLPRIGGVIRSGSLASLVEDPEQIDTVKMRFVMSIPIPLNNIDITVQV